MQLEAELAARGDELPIVDQPWGAREVRVTDPAGNRLVFFAAG